MEFFNRCCLPWCEQLGRLPGRSRLAGGACAVVAALGLWLLLGPRPSADYQPLWEGQKLSAPQIARMTAAFQKHGLHEARISAEGIHVPSRQKSAYLVALDAEQAWPEEFDAPLQAALAGSNPLMPWQQNREQLARGEKQMLARIVEGLEGIETAAVQYDEIRQPGFPPKLQMRAMVAVRAAAGREMDYEQIEAVRDTVAAFKSGLERQHVTVTDLNACRAYPGSLASDLSHAASRTQAAAKRALEHELREKIEQRLRMYPGALVAVHAHYADEQPATASGPAVPWRLVRVNASIDLPKTYFRTVWQQRRGNSSQAPPAQELGDIEREVCGTIERAVAAMLPPPAPGWADQPLVTVTSHDPLSVAAQSPATRWPPPLWLGLLAVGLPLTVAAGVAALIPYRRQRSHVTPAAEDESPWPRTVVSDAASPEADGPGLSSLQEQLTTLVKRDPAAAAEVLKRWLKPAA